MFQEMCARVSVKSTCCWLYEISMRECMNGRRKEPEGRSTRAARRFSLAAAKLNLGTWIVLGSVTNSFVPA